MTIRRFGVAVALCLGLGLSLGAVSHADTSAGNGKKNPPKAKRGDACKVTEDCDQSLGPTSCVSSKCQAEVIHPPVT